MKTVNLDDKTCAELSHALTIIEASARQAREHLHNGIEARAQSEDPKIETASPDVIGMIGQGAPLPPSQSAQLSQAAGQMLNAALANVSRTVAMAGVIPGLLAGEGEPEEPADAPDSESPIIAG